MPDFIFKGTCINGLNLLDSFKYILAWKVSKNAKSKSLDSYDIYPTLGAMKIEKLQRDSYNTYVP